MRSLAVCAVAALLSVSNVPAQAQTRAEAADCWERVYPAVHFAKAPGQRVERMTFLLHRALGAAPVGPGRFREGLLTVKLRADARPGAGQTREVWVYCARRGARLACQPSFDETPILTVEERAGGASILLTNRKIHLNPVGYSAEDMAEDAVKLDPRAGDDVFALTAAPAAACRR